MTESPIAKPPRLIPGRPFPAYAYIPGRTPHPTRDLDGHSHGQQPEVPVAPDPTNWRACPDYLYGIDLFNHGYYWEAHEAWEGLWVACGRRGPTATFLQALINLAAAGFKARWGSARGMRANAKTALRLFRDAAKPLDSGETRIMGLDVIALITFVEGVAIALQRSAAVTSNEESLAFDLVLLPI